MITSPKLSRCCPYTTESGCRQVERWRAAGQRPSCGSIRSNRFERASQTYLEFWIKKRSEKL
jgi:hypothetical protein